MNFILIFFNFPNFLYIYGNGVVTLDKLIYFSEYHNESFAFSQTTEKCIVWSEELCFS